MAYCQLTLADIGASVAELEVFHHRYAAFFETTYAQEESFTSLHSTYVCDRRRNIANRARAVGGNSQNLHPFITNASWPDQPILQQLQRDTFSLIGSATEGALIIDESGFPKLTPNT